MKHQIVHAAKEFSGAVRAPRFYYHHDGSFLHYVPPPITRERFLEETVGGLLGTQVDGIICHMFSFGDAVPLFRSALDDSMLIRPKKLVSINNWRNLHNLDAVLKMESDPWSEAIALAHEHGKEFWAAMRFNDAHPSSYGMRSQFGLAHPEHYLGSRCNLHDEGDPEPCRHLDYSLREVQLYRLRQIEEVCSRYDVDGLELDLTRDLGHFAPGTLEQRAGILSAYLRELRETLERVGVGRGRRLALGLRVPGTPAACWDVAYDVKCWMRQGIMDMLTPSVYYDTSCELPYATWVEMARGSSCRIYASVMEGVGPGRFAPPPKEAVRAAALNAWRAGVCGINLFNFHHQIITDRVQDVELLSQLGDPRTLERADKLYMIAGRGQNYQGQHGSIEPYGFAPDPVGVHQHQLPREVPVEPSGPGIRIQVPIADDVARARDEGTLASIRLRLDLCNLTGEERMDLSWNGVPIVSTAASLQPSLQYPWNWNGMHGQLEASFDLTHGDWVRPGENEFRLILRSRPEDLDLPLRVWALRLEIRYHVLPMRFGM
jgi:hypothetical protein